MYIVSSVKKIGYDAFSQCNGATKLKMSNSIEYIGEGAFRMCAYLAADLDFADSLTYIGADAFCFSNITSVVIPDKTRYIGARAFAACKLQSISLGKGVQYIGEEAFIGYYEGVKSIVIPASVRVIGPNALYSYNQKAELVFEDPEDWTRTPTPHEVEMGEADHGNVSVAWYCEQNGYEGLYNLLCQRYGKPPEDENGDPVPGYENVSFLGTLTVHDIDQMNLPDYIADYYQSYGNSFWLKGFWH